MLVQLLQYQEGTALLNISQTEILTLSIALLPMLISLAAASLYKILYPHEPKRSLSRHASEIPAMVLGLGFVAGIGTLFLSIFALISLHAMNTAQMIQNATSTSESNSMTITGFVVAFLSGVFIMNGSIQVGYWMIKFSAKKFGSNLVDPIEETETTVDSPEASKNNENAETLHEWIKKAYTEQETAQSDNSVELDNSIPADERESFDINDSDDQTKDNS